MSDNPHWDEYQTMLAQYPAECGGEECIGECPIGTPCRGWWDIVVFEIRTQIYDKHDRYSVRSKDVLAWLQKQRFDKSGPFEPWPVWPPVSAWRPWRPTSVLVKNWLR